LPKSRSYRKPFQSLPACRSPPKTFDRRRTAGRVVISALSCPASSR
jgi:hypothetical protein